ncbi:hypothetical protein LBMAG42_51500 [Deltaproteobacteria bacterium]|nr:hypothetical protein LBMAG42_51500 [Deltaproteobacteria bacterium]
MGTENTVCPPLKQLLPESAIAIPKASWVNQSIRGVYSAGMIVLLFAGCPGEPIETGDTAPSMSWQVVGEKLPGALLSVWGTSVDDVFVVGADGGAGPMAYHLSGGEWAPMTGFDPGDLWWVHGGADGIWACGASGRVFHGDENGVNIEGFVTDPAITLFGVWGPGDGTAWTVGGDVSQSSAAAQMWYYDGSSWSKVALPAEAAERIAIFKVWGASASDVWAVGGAGLSMHYDGSAWSVVDTLNSSTLLTVNDGFAVGGTNAGTILKLEGGGTVWTDESPDYAVQINGVRGGDSPVAVGMQGSVWLRDDEGWAAAPGERPTYQDLHGVWRDPDEAIWAVGGHVSADPLIYGTLVYAGGATIPTLEN